MYSHCAWRMRNTRHMYIEKGWCVPLAMDALCLCSCLRTDGWMRGWEMRRADPLLPDTPAHTEKERHAATHSRRTQAMQTVCCCCYGPLIHPVQFCYCESNILYMYLKSGRHTKRHSATQLYRRALCWLAKLYYPVLSSDASDAQLQRFWDFHAISKIDLFWGRQVLNGLLQLLYADLHFIAQLHKVNYGLHWILNINIWQGWRARWFLARSFLKIALVALYIHFSHATAQAERSLSGSSVFLSNMGRTSSIFHKCEGFFYFYMSCIVLKNIFWIH